ncbi:unnamed protein product [Ectocarpus sp. 12 AP-2014]
MVKLSVSSDLSGWPKNPWPVSDPSQTSKPPYFCVIGRSLLFLLFRCFSCCCSGESRVRVRESREPPKTGQFSIDVGVPLYMISYGIYHGCDGKLDVGTIQSCHSVACNR